MYDVVFLNGDFQAEYRCKVIDYYWDSRWYEPGEFQVQVLDDSDLDLEACKYIITNTKKEIGIIGRWQRSSDDPQTVLVSGFFMEQALFDFVVYPTYTKRTSAFQHGEQLCRDYLGDLGLPWTPSATPMDGVIAEESSAVDYQQTGDYVGTGMYAIAAVYGYGVSVTLNADRLSIGIVNYHDRSGDGEDEEVVLSVSFNNLKNYDVIRDATAYKNYAIVAGEGEGSARVFTTVDNRQSDDELLHELWVDARDLSMDADDTIDSYRQKLRQRGLEKLSECVVIDNVEVEISEEDAQRIGIDFDIGDIVGVAINPLRLYYKMKIIEVEDTYSQGKRTVSLVFGSKIPTAWEKVRTLYR